MSQKLPRVDFCQNCGSPTPGNYCADCGQDSREHRVSMRLLLFGLWNDLFTFDSRFFRSFIPLIFRPGRLTREYIHGRRVRFIPPVRLYLFVSILFFFLLSILFKGPEISQEVEQDAPGDSLSLATTVADSTVNPVEADSLERSIDIEEVIFQGGHVSFFGQERDISSEEMISNKDEISAIFFSLAPKGMFILLPIFAGLLALIYRRSRKLFIEHLVFALHYHSYLFILFIFVMLIHKLTDWDLIWPITMVGFHLYLYLAMKKVYRQGWLKTWVKHFLLTSSYNLALFVSLMVIFITGIYLASVALDHPWLMGWFDG
jgi:hypothetical protein